MGGLVQFEHMKHFLNSLTESEKYMCVCASVLFLKNVNSFLF